MAISEPYPELSEIMETIGEAGRRLSEIDASEGAAGNISVYIGWKIEPRRQFPFVEEIELPVKVPELAGGIILVTGSGRRLRDIHLNPVVNLACVQIRPGGETGSIFTAPGCLFQKPTSEFNSHLAIHRDQVTATGTNFHAVIHAQPPYLTYLSHIARYQDETYFNQHVLRWEPEIIVQMPEGIGVLPFIVPGSKELMSATAESLRMHRVVIWSKHGVVSRSEISAKRASDRIEYAEAGARYEYMNLVNGEAASGLSAQEVAAICASFGIQQEIFKP